MIAESALDLLDHELICPEKPARVPSKSQAVRDRYDGLVFVTFQIFSSAPQ